MIQIDEIGTLYEVPTNNQDMAIAINGWHVNTSHPIKQWEAMMVKPTNPRRVFGGIPTIFYTFPTKEEFDKHLALTDLSEPQINTVPKSVTRRQARQALLLAGLLAKVQPAIDMIQDNTQKEMLRIEWEDSQVFERDRPSLILLASVLGMSNEDLDKLFIDASLL